MYTMTDCTAFEAGKGFASCAAMCGGACCRPAASVPPRIPPPLAPPPVHPPPPPAPAPPCGNFSVALGHPGMSLAFLSAMPLTNPMHINATAQCRALLAPAGAAGSAAPVAWAQLEFCAGCADAAGCQRFCACLVQHVPGRPFDACGAAAAAAHKKGVDNGGAWGALLPLSILIFFGGFLCQMYIKQNKRAAGGGLGGRGNAQEEGTELLATCMPMRGRPNEVDNPNEKMMPARRRAGIEDEDDDML